MYTNGRHHNDGYDQTHGPYAQIIGWGSYAPERVVTNHDLEQIVDTTDEWIQSRTGIRERRIASSGKDTTASMAVRAGRGALRVADVSAARVDLIIVATCTPEHLFPSTASLVQDALGADKAGAFDLSAACSGFVYALSLARDAIVSGSAEYVLVIGSETMSRLIDWSDRNTCVLFGDGAGAVLLAASDVPGGVLSTVLGSDGSGGALLQVPGGGSRNPTTLETVSSGAHYIKMEGREVFRFATRVMAQASQEAIAKAGLSLDDVALVIPHQANRRIIEAAVMRQLKIPEEKVVINLERYGNTSSASIPIALCEALEAGRLKPGDNLVMVGFGAGLTWAAAALKWSVPVPVPPSPWWRTAQRRAHYQAAQARSFWRRLGRRVYAITVGSPDSPGWRGRLRASLDAAHQVWTASQDKPEKLEEETDIHRNGHA